jgi:hypothetical protein
LGSATIICASIYRRPARKSLTSTRLNSSANLAA